uniref:PiggyBac transposable element-derived protein domain-containing protein n=1 Tax=Leptobrachium leishanense TaxID=445787 RepID=A0A8C5Q2Y3_9ANUR
MELPGCSRGNAGTARSVVALPDPAPAQRPIAGVSATQAVAMPEPGSDWTSPNMVQPVLPQFSGNPGILVDTTNFEPINFFQLFIDDGFLEFIVQQSNLYAEQYFQGLGAELLPSARARKWTPTSLPEMRKFWGLTLQMGIVQKPSIASYWSKKSTQTTPIFPATMSRDRYLLLLRYLHYNDNANALPRDHPDHDRLYKLRPLLDHLMARFEELYTPGQNLSVDESLLLYKGRLVFKQYIPSKRARYGIKLYKLCESSSGYMYRFRVYTGKDSQLAPPDCPPALSTTEKIVWDLAYPLFGKGYCIYTDNFYTGVPLYKFLYSNGTGACGTIRSNRKGFPTKQFGKQKRGETSALRCGELLAVKYTDKKDVHLLTTIHNECTSAVHVRWRDSPIMKPLCVQDYNRYMGGVDKSDQMLVPYLASRKAYVWYKKLAVHLIQMSMLNAFILYQATHARRITFLKFQESVIESLLCPEENAPIVEEVEDVIRLRDRHFPGYIPPTEKRVTPCKRCRVCARQGRRKESRLHCPDCPSKPGLCVPDCFKIYHTVTHY